MNGSDKNAFERLPLIISFEEKLANIETYGFSGTQGSIYLEGQLLRPRARPAKTVIVFMHPASTLQLLPLPVAMAEAGLHVMCCGSRYAKNDSALIMEKVAIDLGAYVRHAREVLGYEKVILAGWSGGASLSLFYQGEAEQPSITHTPAGDPVDLCAARLSPADAVMMIAAHGSRARILSEWIDPSLLDEHNPDARDPELDLYDPNNANQAPYAPAFLEKYRAGQLARIRRITATVRQTLEDLKARGGKEHERSFVVHRTMADPRWLDPAVDPNERTPRTCYLGDPEAVNAGPAGMARYSSLRSWLSQWSIDDSRADGIVGAGRISVPLLVIENGADDACPASHPRQVYDAGAQTDRRMHLIAGATHYYKNQPQQLAEALAMITGWLGDKELLSC